MTSSFGSRACFSILDSWNCHAVLYDLAVATVRSKEKEGICDRGCCRLTIVLIEVVVAWASTEVGGSTTQLYGTNPSSQHPNEPSQEPGRTGSFRALLPDVIFTPGEFTVPSKCTIAKTVGRSV